MLAVFLFRKRGHLSPGGPLKISPLREGAIATKNTGLNIYSGASKHSNRLNSFSESNFCMHYRSAKSKVHVPYKFIGRS